MTDHPVTATPASFIARVSDLLQLLEGVSGESGKAAQIVAAASDLRAMLASPATPLQVPLDEFTRTILGRAPVHRDRMARLLRSDGQQIPNDPIDEQAAVMVYLLNAYLRHGPHWDDHVEVELDRIRGSMAAAKAATPA